MNNPVIKIDHVVIAQESVNSLTDEDRGKISDGYHSFDELYTFRKLYNALIVNEIQNQIDTQQEILVQNDRSKNMKGGHTHVGKSKRHSDGELCFGGDWFVVYIIYNDIKLENALVISNHYHMDDWDLFQVPESYKGPEYDGHTTTDVIERLNDLIRLRTKDREIEDYVAIVDDDYDAFENGGELDNSDIDALLSIKSESDDVLDKFNAWKSIDVDYDDYRGGMQWAR